jgi:hypothetical protein
MDHIGIDLHKKDSQICILGSRWASTWPTRKAWWGRKRPARACRNAGSLRRSAPRARSAKTSGSRVPWVRASSMARPETPSTLLATEANLMPASSRTF